MNQEQKTDGAACSAVLSRIKAYLTTGGAFNPELADHLAVRDLLIDCRETLVALMCEAENAKQDHAQADTDTLRALHERNEARKERDKYKDLVEMWVHAFSNPLSPKSMMQDCFEKSIQAFESSLPRT